MTFF
jgi:hypothetical protein